MLGLLKNDMYLVLSRNLEVKRNPEYNMKMVGEANHNRKHTSLDLNIMYGPDFSDDSKRIDMMLESNHLISNYMPRDVDLSTRIRFPALVSGQYSTLYTCIIWTLVLL